MTFSWEVRHEGLRRSRVIQGPDPHAVQRGARAQLEAWESQWAVVAGRSGGSKEGGREPKDVQRPSSREEGHRISTALTEEAQEELRGLGEIFPGKPPQGAPVLPDQKPFPEAPPEQPHLPDPKPKPLRAEGRFQPKLGLFDRVVPSRRRILEKEAERRFQAAWTAWYQQETEVQEALLEYQVRFEEWDQRRLDFEDGRRRLLRERRELEDRLDQGDPAAIVEYFSGVLSSARLPAFLPKDARVSLDESTRILAVDHKLPCLEDIPSLVRVTFREDQGDFLEEHLPEADHLAAYDSVVYQLALRTAKEILSAGRVKGLRAVTFNGWVDALDPATGQKRKLYLVALETAADRFAEIVPDRVSPQACFMAMGGVCAGEPHRFLAIPPIVASARSAAGTSEPRVESPGTGLLDLTTLSLQAFRQAVLRALEERFMPKGGELQVTIVREDGSLEAIGRGPGSEREGDVIFHVRRSAAPVGEKAIRDLLSRMASEKAVSGVFLTTGDFAPGAIHLARGKPLSLYDGHALRRLVVRETTSGLPQSGRPSGDQGYMETRPQ